MWKDYVAVVPEEQGGDVEEQGQAEEITVEESSHGPADRKCNYQKVSRHFSLSVCISHVCTMYIYVCDTSTFCWLSAVLESMKMYRYMV